MVVQVVGAVAGAAARGAAVGARAVGQAAITGTRVAAKGAASTARGAEKGAGATVKTSLGGVRVVNRAVTQGSKTGYRVGRAFGRAVREAKNNKEIEKYGYSTRADPQRFSRVDPRRTGARLWNAIPVPGVAKRVALEMLPAGTKTQAARMGLITRAPGWVRRQNMMNKARAFAGLSQKTKVQRISKMEGRVMIAVAVLFDLLPLLLIIGPITAILMAAGNNPDCSVWEGPWDYTVCKAAGITKGLGGLAAVIALIVYSPMVYAFGSFLSVVLGLLVFGAWFMFKGVSPVSLGLYMIFEAVPVVNILPMFTTGVWRCVKGAAREDEQRGYSGGRQMVA